MSNKARFPYSVLVDITQDGRRLPGTVLHAGPVYFGRGSHCDVVLPSETASDMHASLEAEDGQMVLRDLRSKNGTLVDGQRIAEIVLNGAVTLQFGNLTVTLTPMAAQTQSQVKMDSVEVPAVPPTERPEIKIDLNPVDEITAKIVLAPEAPSKRPSLPVQPTQPTPSVSIPGVVAAGAPAKTKTSVKSKSHSPSPSYSAQLPMIDRNFSPDFLDFHQGVSKAQVCRLEAILTWKGTVHEVKEFIPNEKLTVGPSMYASMNIPVLKKGWKLADVSLDHSKISIPTAQAFRLKKNGKDVSAEALASMPNAKKVKSGLVFKLETTDILDLDLGSEMSLVLRYIPATQDLKVRHLVEPDIAIKRSLFGSGLIHALVAITLVVLAPVDKKIPKLKNVEERYARLLMDPPKPIVPVPEVVPPPPPPEPLKAEVKKPEPKPVVKKEEKIQPKKYVMPNKLKKLNKLPITVKKANHEAPPVVGANIPKTKPEPKPVKVESLGALAGLSSSPDLAPSAPVKDIQISKDAGGAPGSKVNLSKISAPTSSGRGMLVASGGGGVRTGGKGIGSGSAYGTQGLSGKSGSRMIAGSIVGAPMLSKVFVSEGLTREQVMSEVKKHVGEVQACYERSLVSSPNLNGRMEFEWEISPAGNVSGAQVKKSSVAGGDALGECVKDIFNRMKFPKSKNGQSTTPSIGFPFGRM